MGAKVETETRYAIPSPAPNAGGFCARRGPRSCSAPKRYPHFLQVTAEIEDTALDDPAASLRSWQALVDAASERRVARPAMADARGRLGVALALDRMGNTIAAIPQLRAVIAARPEAPYGALAQAHLQLGIALDRVGARSEARDAYRAALASLPPGDRTRIGERARARLRAR